jgi:hypothetical protein
MCEATTIAALSIASTAVQTFGQFQQAKSQKQAIQGQLEQTAAQQREETEVAIGQRTAEARAESARFRVAAGESGVAGASIGAGQQALGAAASRDVALLRRQQQLGLQAAGAQARAASSRVNQPTLLSAGLQIAGTAATQGAKIRGQRQSLQIPTTAPRSIR